MAGITAVILAGGEGLRLRPLTLDLPKSMLPVLNRPFLEHMILRLRAHGVDRVVLALAYLPQTVSDYFGDGARFGVKVEYAIEESPLGTAGAVKNAAAHLSGTFLVLNGDILMDLDVSALLKRHREKKALATIAIHAVDDPSRFGVVPIDNAGRVLRFVEKPPGPDFPSRFINSGCYVLDSAILERIPENQPFMFETHLFPALVADGKPVFGYKWEGYWQDMGTVESYLALHQDLLEDRTGTPFRKQGVAVTVGPECEVNPTARLVGPLILGRGCVIGPGAQVVGPAVLGEGCRLEARALVVGAVLWDRVLIGEGARLVGSVAAHDVVLGDGAAVDAGTILARGAVVPAGRRLKPGALVQAGGL